MYYNKWEQFLEDVSLYQDELLSWGSSILVAIDLILIMLSVPIPIIVGYSLFIVIYLLFALKLDCITDYLIKKSQKARGVSDTSSDVETIQVYGDCLSSLITYLRSLNVSNDAEVHFEAMLDSDYTLIRVEHYKNERDKVTIFAKID